MACEREPRERCAPRTLADGLGELLHDDRYHLPGTRVRVFGSPYRWVVEEVITRLFGRVNVAVAYRLVCLTPLGLRVIVVPAVLIEPDTAAPAPVPAPITTRGPTLTDVIATAAQKVRDALRDAEAETEPEAPAPVTAQAGDEKPAASGPEHGHLAWNLVSPTVRLSKDSRFTISAEREFGGTWYAAWDAWTGEAVSRLTTSYAAEQWCRIRTTAPALDWQDYGAALVARTADGVPFAVTTAGIVHLAHDARFPLGSPLRLSPVFLNIENAKAWCAVRACCAVEPAPKGGSPTLRFQDPVPF